MAIPTWQQIYMDNAKRRQLLPEDVIQDAANMDPATQAAAASFAETLKYPGGVPEAERVTREIESGGAVHSSITRVIEQAMKTAGTLDPSGSNRNQVAEQATAQGLFDQFSDKGYNIDRIQRILNAAGYGSDAIPTTMSSVIAQTGQTAIDEGRIQELNEWSTNAYNEAKTNQWSSQDLATRYNLMGTPVTKEQIDIIIKAAGLGPLNGRQPYGQPGATAPLDSLGPEYDGGLPGRQPDGLGMYGGAGANGTPENIFGEMPRHPQLAAVSRNARRRAAAGYQGQSDTILTGSRGASGPLMLARKKLIGV